MTSPPETEPTPDTRETELRTEATALLKAISIERRNPDSWSLEALDGQVTARATEDEAFKVVLVETITEWVSNRMNGSRAHSAYELAGQLATESLLTDEEIVQIAVAFHDR